MGVMMRMQAQGKPSPLDFRPTLNAYEAMVFGSFETLSAFREDKYLTLRDIYAELDELGITDRTERQEITSFLSKLNDRWVMRYNEKHGNSTSSN